ncbi:UNVERIFIED_CONTAM: hypothetical protein K2H54_052078 [Gekko kuhli]
MGSYPIPEEKEKENKRGTAAMVEVVLEIAMAPHKSDLTNLMKVEPTQLHIPTPTHPQRKTAWEIMCCCSEAQCEGDWSGEQDQSHIGSMNGTEDTGATERGPDGFSIHCWKLKLACCNFAPPRQIDLLPGPDSLKALFSIDWPFNVQHDQIGPLG